MTSVSLVSTSFLTSSLSPQILLYFRIKIKMSKMDIYTHVSYAQPETNKRRNKLKILYSNFAFPPLGGW
jgi:hypothetical protein